MSFLPRLPLKRSRWTRSRFARWYSFQGQRWSQSLLVSSRAPPMNGPLSSAGWSPSTISLPPLVLHHAAQSAARSTSISPLVMTSQIRCLQISSIPSCWTDWSDRATMMSQSTSSGGGRYGKESISANTSTVLSDSNGCPL